MLTGFFRMKAKNIIACARDLVERFGGRVPREREDLESLAGVGRKTASVVMANAFQEPALAVDTHVFRVSHRLGLTLGTTPRQVEDDLTALVPPEKWGDATHWLILHGRAVCKAPTPQCPRCPVNHLCPTPAIIAKANVIRRRGLPRNRPAQKIALGKLLLDRHESSRLLLEVKAIGEIIGTIVGRAQ